METERNFVGRNKFCPQTWKHLKKRQKTKNDEIILEIQDVHRRVPQTVAMKNTYAHLAQDFNFNRNCNDPAFYSSFF